MVLSSSIPLISLRGKMRFLADKKHAEILSFRKKGGKPT